MRDENEREERLRHILTAYSYRLIPPARNITNESEAQALFAAEFEDFLSKHEPLNRAKGMMGPLYYFQFNTKKKKNRKELTLKRLHP